MNFLSDIFFVGLFLIILAVGLSLLFEKLSKKTEPQKATPTPAQLEQQYAEDYKRFFTGVVYPLMKANHEALKLEPPRAFAQHDPGPGHRVGHQKAKLAFGYVFRRESLISGGVENLHIQYSALPTRQMETYLQPLLDSYAIAAGFPLSTLAMKDYGTGRVVMAVIFNR